MAPKTIWTWNNTWGGTSASTSDTGIYQMNTNTDPFIIPDYAQYKKDLVAALDEFNDEPFDEHYDDDNDIDEDGYCTCPSCQQEKKMHMGGNMKEELSFVMFKPDAFERGLVGELMKIVDSKGVRLVGAKTLTMTESQLATHYNHHVGKTFWPQMVEFYTSGPTMACVYKGVHANSAIRQLIGNKHPSDSPAGSIRGKYATSFPKNLIHGSDSAGDASHEMELFFTQTEIQKFKKA